MYPGRTTTSLHSTTRAEGLPSGVLVASTMAFGFGCSRRCHASASHSFASCSGSGGSVSANTVSECRDVDFMMRMVEGWQYGFIPLNSGWVQIARSTVQVGPHAGRIGDREHVARCPRYPSACRVVHHRDG